MKIFIGGSYTKIALPNGDRAGQLNIQPSAWHIWYYE
jgi:hypothetical protein